MKIIQKVHGTRFPDGIVCRIQYVLEYPKELSDHLDRIGEVVRGCTYTHWSKDEDDLNLFLKRYLVNKDDIDWDQDVVKDQEIVKDRDIANDQDNLIKIMSNDVVNVLERLSDITVKDLRNKIDREITGDQKMEKIIEGIKDTVELGIMNGHTEEESFSRAVDKVFTYGLTYAMFQGAVAHLRADWSRGERFHEWYNKNYEM